VEGKEQGEWDLVDQADCELADHDDIERPVLIARSLCPLGSFLMRVVSGTLLRLH